MESDKVHRIYRHLGPFLTARLRTAKVSVRIYSAFVRSETLARLESAIPKDVDVTLTMRWDDGIFQHGASDPAVFTVCREAGITLQKHTTLHLKSVVIDDEELITGSANLTERALGAVIPPNVEVLVAGLVVSDTDRETFSFIDSGASPVTEADHAAALRSFRSAAVDPCSARPPRVGGCSIDQIPALSSPREFWRHYEGYTASVALGRTARHDLGAFHVPPGMDELGCMEILRNELLARPLFVRLTDTLRSRELYFGELKRWLSRVCEPALAVGDLTEPADRLLNWIEGLGSPRFAVDRPNHSERLRYETDVEDEPVLRAAGQRQNKQQSEETDAFDY